MNTHSFVARPGYEAIRAYRSDRPSVEIDLTDSTNQWGVAPSALAAMSDWSWREISEYLPDTQRLTDAVAAYAGTDPDTIVTGCGSDNVIDSAIRALAEPGAKIAHPAPTFVMIPVAARANGLEPVAVPVLPDGDVDADAMLATRAEIMYLCTPNNPTGTPHRRESVERIINEAPGVVILDEAYAEFADDVFTPNAPRFPHVLATRTLSKSFGLAALRIGYGVGAPELVNEVLKARGPYRVNVFAERAAFAALTHDREWMRAHARDVREMRDRFSAALRTLGFQPHPSEANFLCVPVRDANQALDELGRRSIAVRGFRALPVVGDVLRIGLAPWPVLERVLEALSHVAR